ncbi:hypothetical protein JCM3774_004114 [Rhodotorula dairenensis]
MASIALSALRQARRPAQHALDAFVVRTSSSSSPSVPAPLYTSTAAALASLIPDTLASLRDLLPPWLLAAPKRRTTHGAKRMRSSNKGLKEKQNIVSCPACGSPKLAHHLCHECHTAFRREIHREARGNGLPTTEAPPVL